VVIVEDSPSLPPESILRNRDVRGEYGLEKRRDGTELGIIFPHTSTVCISISIIMMGTSGAKRPWFTGIGPNEPCEPLRGWREKAILLRAPSGDSRAQCGVLKANFVTIADGHSVV